MRLICGLMMLDGSDADEELLRRMAAEMDVPRLAPALSIWREGAVALAILDFSGDGAPEIARHGGRFIAADVRLDEPHSAPAHGCAATSQDARLLAALEGGIDGLARVSGDFAFAQWDRDTGTMTCARDGFGVRPFAYVHQPGKLFAFASFGAALHGSGIVPKTVDREALARRVVQAPRADDSLIAGIARLPPAHALRVSRDGITLTRYWQLDRAAVGTRNISPDEAAAELRRLFEKAVASRLPERSAVGAHLSGGLDSSAISIIAARQLREAGRLLHAYSFLERTRDGVAFEDETAFVEAVLAQEPDIDWTPVRPALPSGTWNDALDADRMIPLNSDALENQVCARAEQQGVKLILSGWGGDEAATFNGRGTLAELLMRGRWRTLAREFLALRRERGWSWKRMLYAEIVSYVVPDRLFDLSRRGARRRPDLDQMVRRCFAAPVRERLGNDGRITLTADARENRWCLVNGVHIAERAEIWAQIGARHGLAFAFPLLDRRVVEFALSLPSAHFLRGGFRRRLFRDAMVDVLPDKVRWRHEKYTPTPGRLLDLAEGRADLLTRLDAFAREGSGDGLIDFDYVRRLADEFPDPERVRRQARRNRTAGTSGPMIAVARILDAASYLKQHGMAKYPSRDIA